MDPTLRTQLEARARILKALAHPIRLYIVHLLRDSECSVQQITDQVDLEVSTVSRHLHQLQQVGIVSRRKQATQALYTLRAHCILPFFSCLENVLTQNASEDACCMLPLGQLPTDPIPSPGGTP